jgi:hypothetical protein
MDDGRMDDPEMRRHLANIEVLQRIPGVTRVGFGLKESRGEIVPEWAYRVYVRIKRSTSELPDSEMIPPELGGLRTDVLAGVPGDIRPESGRSLSPGDGITREIFNQSTETGTVGLLVRKDTGRFILTADHVLEDRLMVSDGSNNEIYSPRIKEIAGARCNKPSAHIAASHGVQDHILFEGKKFFVDATIAPIYDGVKGTNTLPGIGPLDQGLRDIANVPMAGSAPAQMIRVAKVGGTTGLTRGTVVELFHNVTLPSPSETFVTWEIIVRADAAHAKSYDKEVRLAPGQDIENIKSFFAGGTVSAQISGDPERQMLRLSGYVFSLVGDSGSCLVDEGRRILGIHTAGRAIRLQIVENGSTQTTLLPNGLGVSSFIRPVFSQMGLNEATGVIPPGSPSSGAALTPPETEEPHWEAPEPPVLEHLDSMLTLTPAGRRLRAFAGRHGEQIAHLVHERRRVLVVWHRAHGPGYAAAFLRALGEPEGRLPQEIGGVRLVDLFSRMRDVLLREGDEELRRAIGDHGDLILALAERARSVPELRAALAEVDR